MNVADQLHCIMQQLTPQVEHVSLRGQERASFVFAQHNGRAVEISESDGQWWLEFWDVSPDQDAPPAKELTVPTYLEAVKEAGDWLAGRGERAARPIMDPGVPRAAS